MTKRSVQFIACGALAHEVTGIIRQRGWEEAEVTCLPAQLHNRPQRIPELLREKICEARADYDEVAVLYGDCGTGGLIDAVCRDEGVERIAGPHCYSFYSGNKAFEEILEFEPTTYYLTDYLVQHFEKIVWAGLGLDRYPELLKDYFGNYTQLVYLAQTDREDLKNRARQVAERLSLAYEYRYTGMGDLDRFMRHAVEHNAGIKEMAGGNCDQCAKGACHVRS